MPYESASGKSLAFGFQMSVDRLPAHPKRFGDGLDRVLPPFVHLPGDPDHVGRHGWGTATNTARSASAHRTYGPVTQSDPHRTPGCELPYASIMRRRNDR